MRPVSGASDNLNFTRAFGHCFTRPRMRRRVEVVRVGKRAATL